MFFSFDGLDGVGKSTQMDLFCAWLTERGHELVRCRDPGSTPAGEAIRELLLSNRFPIARSAEMLLFMAARAELVEEIIRPAIADGKTVVSDRYVLANVVYQGHAGGLDPESIWQVGRLATGGVTARPGVCPRHGARSCRGTVQSPARPNGKPRASLRTATSAGLSVRSGKGP